MVERQLLERRARAPGRASHSDQVVDRGSRSRRLRCPRRARSTVCSTRRQRARRSDEPRQHVVALAAIEIAVSGDQHARLDLAEAIEDALHAEIGRTRRPDRADRRGAERGDDRFRQVRHVRRRRDRRPNARAAAAPPRTVATSRVELRVTSASRRRPSPLKMMAGASSRRRRRFSAKFSRASGKNLAPGIWSRSSTTRVAHVAADAAEHPDLAPEIRRPVDRETIQIVVVGTGRRCPRAHVAHERGHRARWRCDRQTAPEGRHRNYSDQ